MSDMTPPPVPPAPPAPPYVPPAPQMTGRPGPANDTSKILAALSYPIPLIALIVLFVDPYKNEKFVKWHAVQALGLDVAVFVVSFVGVFLAFLPFIGGMIGSLINVAALVGVIFMAYKTYSGEYVEIPVVYGLVKQFVGE